MNYINHTDDKDAAKALTGDGEFTKLYKTYIKKENAKTLTYTTFNEMITLLKKKYSKTIGAEINILYENGKKYRECCNTLMNLFDYFISEDETNDTKKMDSEYRPIFNEICKLVRQDVSDEKWRDNRYLFIEKVKEYKNSKDYTNCKVKYLGELLRLIRQVTDMKNGFVDYPDPFRVLFGDEPFNFTNSMYALNGCLHSFCTDLLNATKNDEGGDDTDAIGKAKKSFHEVMRNYGDCVPMSDNVNLDDIDQIFGYIHSEFKNKKKPIIDGRFKLGGIKDYDAEVASTVIDLIHDKEEEGRLQKQSRSKYGWYVWYSPRLKDLEQSKSETLMCSKRKWFLRNHSNDVLFFTDARSNSMSAIMTYVVLGLIDTNDKDNNNLQYYSKNREVGVSRSTVD